MYILAKHGTRQGPTNLLQNMSHSVTQLEAYA